MGISNNIKRLREYYDLSQQDLADIANVTDKAVSTWEVGTKTPRMGAIEKISMHFNIPKSAIVDDFDEYVKEKRSYLKSGLDDRLVAAKEKKGVKIPVLGRVQAGVPVEAIEEILDYEEITQEMASQGEHFGLRVNGDSMEPKFSNGDVVIVRKQPDADTGDIAIVLVNGSVATIKKIKKGPDGIMLVPTNPMYEVMFYNNQEMEQLPVRIIGKVVELRAKF